MKKYRLVTRNDIDGLMCGALLNELEMIDDVLFTHPAEIQKNNIEITERDIIANLPYNEKAHLVFDHHESEMLRVSTLKSNFILDTSSKSVSRVLFNYFGGSKKFKKITWQMIKQIDNAKGNGISYNDVIDPKDWILLSIILDSRTGLERFINTEILNSKEYIAIQFIDRIAELGVKNFLFLPDVRERIELMEKYKEDFINQIDRCSKVVNNNIVLMDKRNEKIIYPGNRFFVFTRTEEEVDYLVHVIEGFYPDEVTIAIRQNPLTISRKVHIGNILYELNGGGNSISGSCQVKTEDLEKTLAYIYKKLI